MPRSMNCTPTEQCTAQNRSRSHRLARPIRSDVRSLLAGRLRSRRSRGRNVESIIANFEAVALSNQRHCKVAADGLVAYFHGPFPCLPNRVTRGLNDQGCDGEIVKSRLEPLVGILLDGVAALDNTLRRHTDAVLGEKGS